MQKEFVENWTRLCQSATKPMLDLMELNATTLNNLTKNTNVLEEFGRVKKPEDFINMQTKLIGTATQEMTLYTQRAMEIAMDAIARASDAYQENIRQASQKVQTATRETANRAAETMRGKNREN